MAERRRDRANKRLRVAYIHNHWDGLQTFLTDGRVEIDYMKSTLEAIASGHPKSRIDDLLPWNFRPST